MHLPEIASNWSSQRRLMRDSSCSDFRSSFRCHRSVAGSRGLFWRVCLQDVQYLSLALADLKERTPGGARLAESGLIALVCNSSGVERDRKSTRLNSSHQIISY